MTKAEQMNVMRDWFLGRYENPVENCPHISSEGGFQFIWGGPFDAHDILYEQFERTYDNSAIEALGDELFSECCEWSRIPTPDDYDDAR